MFCGGGTVASTVRVLPYPFELLQEVGLRMLDGLQFWVSFIRPRSGYDAVPDKHPDRGSLETISIDVRADNLSNLWLYLSSGFLYHLHNAAAFGEPLPNSKTQCILLSYRAVHFIVGADSHS